MLDWIFEGIVHWISGIVAQVMDSISGIFLDTLGTDMTVMEEYFPFVTKAFSIMQYTAWAILFLITAWQLFRVFGGPITEAENPLTLLARSSLFALLIGYAKPIFSLTLDIARAPYTALMDVSMTAEDFTFVGVEEVLKNGLTTFVSIVSVVGAILLIILEISLGWNYFKLLLETVERYIVVGVLCYTSPLAYAMGGSKTTNSVFKSWCRMVGSQLLLLVLNVWFLRAFNTSVGQYVSNGGALTGGGGSVFLWMFCALAFLKTAQKFDSYLASMGLNVAQTGSSMGMEMLMAARVLSGIGSGARSAGNVFRGGSAATSAAGAGMGGFASGFVNKFRGSSYVRDAVVNGGSNMGAGGAMGFVGRAFGGIAARNGAKLTSDAISSVAAKPSNVSGSIAGDIADRSLSNYMPGLAGQTLSGTQITGGQISTSVIGKDGKQTQVSMFSADQFEKPDATHSVVTASDGSTWFQMASGANAGQFYSVPEFTGSVQESAQVGATFPDAEFGTTLRTVEDGVLEASEPGASSTLYSADLYDEPLGAYDLVTDAGGNNWYQISGADIANGTAEFPSFSGTFENSADTVSFSDMGDDTSFSTVGNGVVEATSADGSTSMLYDAESYAQPEGAFSTVTADDGSQWYQLSGEDIASGSATPPEFTGEEPISFSSMGEGTTFNPVASGIVEANSEDGSSSLLYNANSYAEPEGPHSTVTADDGSQWYQVARGDIDTGNVSAPQYTGTGSPTGEDSQSAVESLSGMGANLTPVANGVVEATEPSDSNTLWYSSAHYEEPDAPHTVMQSANGVDWYAMQTKAEAPEFGSGEASQSYNRAEFREFMPGFEGKVTSVDGSQRTEGRFEVRHADGNGTMFYDTARYAPPRGDYQVYEDAKGKQWFAIKGEAVVERKPVYKNGKPVYDDNDRLETKQVEGVRYRNTPQKYGEPKRRKKLEIKTPRRKRQ